MTNKASPASLSTLAVTISILAALTLSLLPLAVNAEALVGSVVAPVSSDLWFTPAGQVSLQPVSAPVLDVDAQPRQVPAASLALNVPSQVLIGEDVSFTVAFDNTGSDPGYGPIIDLILDTTGADADSGGGSFDGLGTSSITASYLSIPFQTSGANQNMWVISFDGGGNATHPLMRDSSGNYITVSGTPGDTLVVLRLPFGSFAPDQPPATVDVTVNMSNFADIGDPLSIQARGGFEFGATPLDDWCCGDTGPSTLTSWTTSTVTPTLLTLSKSYGGPEDEAASGPNFRTYYPLQYTLTIDIAPGQNLTSVTLEDQLPNNLQAANLISSSPPGASCSAVGSVPGEALDCSFPGSVSGGASLTFDFYVPLENASGADVIDASTGNDVTSCNDTSASYYWVPLDPRDSDDEGADNVSPTGCEHTLTDKSLALQKGVTNLTGGGNSPGDTLEYALTFQVSDYFAFDALVISDTISDGQHLSSTPTLEVTGNGFSLVNGAFNGANFDVLCDYSGTPGGECTVPDTIPGDTGETLLTLRISDELISRSRPNGWMIGGCVDPAGGSAPPECDTGQPGGFNDGPTYATVRFQTTILDEFIDSHLLPGNSGDASVDQGDVLNNAATITGDVLDTDTLTPTGFDEIDSSSAGAEVGTGTVSKSIYAINDNTSFTTPLEVKPDDKITYRITYTQPFSDEENLELTDYLPLPIFHVGDPDEDGSAGPAWAFDPTVSGISPAAGVAKFGPSDTFFDYTCDPGGTPSGCLAPTLTSDVGNNSLNFYYGDFNDPRHQPTTIDLLFSVLVSDDPFADRLYLTNQVHSYEGSTNAGTVAADDIIQIILTEPVLVSNKAAIWSSNPNAVFDPATTGPVTFLDRSTAPRYGSTINSTNLASWPIDSNVSFVDAGDIVTFAIVIENTGSSLNGAFDLVIRDDLPAEFQIPADATGLNLQVYYGNPASGAIGYNGLGGGPDAINGTDDDLFGNGIELVDPVGSGVCQAHDPNLGNNIILITFDLQLRDDVTPGTIVNTESLVNYAGSEGGPNHLPTPQTDTAETSVNGVLAKALDSSGIEHADNTRAEVVIGEIATYTVTVDIPEGEMPGAAVQDTLDAGLTFLDCQSISASSAVTTTIGTGDFSDACSSFIDPAVVSPGTNVRFNLGTLTNSDRDNSITEQIAITYRVVALNTAGNQAGTGLNNSAVLSWTGGSLPAVSAPNVTVIEPVLEVGKSVVVNGSGTAGDAGDPLVYTITVQHDGTSAADAFDVGIFDDLPVASPGGPSLIDGASLDSVSDTASILGTGDFTLSGSDATGYSLATNTPFDLTLTPPAGPTPRILTFTISGNLALAVEPGTFDNTAQATWTSLDEVPVPSPRSPYNTNSVERTGSGVGPNDYFTEATATVNVIATPGKSIVATSETHTGYDGTQERLAIGEIVRYRVSVDIPEGTSTNLQIRDQLPQGLLLQDVDQVMVSFTADADVTEAADLAGADNDAVPPTFLLPAGRIATSFASSRQTVTFSLGNMVNNDNDPGAETITLEFNALVDNSTTGSNDAGDNRNNAFELLVNGVVVSSSSTVNARISEPSITNVNKTASPTSGDAGDVIGYTITFSNANGANNTTAFDLLLIDSLPADMTLNLASLTASSTGNCATGFDTSNSAGNYIDVRIASVPAGCAVSITFDAALNSTVTAAQVLTNNSSLTYTSLPGPNGTSGNSTGSTTPGSSGSGTGERDGSGGLNDYSDSDGATVTVPEVVPVKSIVDSSDANTSGSDLTIGEVVRYRLAVTIPEGTSLAFTLTDTLPAGFSYTGNPKLSFLADADTTEAVDLSGADNEALPPTFDFPVARVSVVGQDVTFSLGNLVNNDSDIGGETVVLEFDALVNNSANNQNTNLKNNIFNVEIDSADRGDSNIVTATIVEPQLTIDKAAVDDTPALGETLTYQITIGNPSSVSDAMAYDVIITDVIPSSPPELTYVGPVLPLPAGWSLDDSAAPTLVFSTSQLALDETVTLEYQVTLGIPPDVIVGDTFTNTATATWTSLGGPDADERTGDDGVGGVLNDYAASSSETITASEVDVTLTKDDGIISAIPGQTVTYSLTITNLGNVDATGVSVTDTVPDYTTFAGPSGPAAWDCAPGAASGSVCTYNVGGLAAGASTVITYSVNVISPLPALVDLTTNDASVSATNEPALLTGNNAASHDTLLIAAPDLTITKDDGIDTVSPSEVLSFTLTFSNVGDQDASGVEITDEVPSNTTFNAAVSSPGWSCDDPDGSGPLGPGDPGSTCTFLPDSGSGAGNIPAGDSGSVQFALTVDDPFPVGVSLVINSASITDDGSNGPDQNPADNTDSDRDNVVTLGDVDINKSLFATSQAHTDPGDAQLNSDPPVAIGEILTYEIVLNLPPGTITNVTLTDQLDRGLAFVDCVFIAPSSTNLTTTLPGGFGAACSPNPINPALGNPEIQAPSAADEDQGRTIVFDFGDMTNTNDPATGPDETLMIRYTAVVIDNLANNRGLALNNAVLWEWDTGNLVTAANTVTIAEPTLTLTKTASPRIVPPGTPVTFTLTVGHASSSNTDAFDLVLTDVLPPQLTYVPTSLSCTSGICTEAAGTITVAWDTFALASTSTIEFQATLSSVAPGERVANEVSLEWTSLPNDNVSAPFSLSGYNPLAVERRYDPATPADVYRVVASVLVGAPALPETGFAPNQTTDLPPAPSQSPYSSIGEFRLVIPKLNLSEPIVGVATDDYGWDLTWLWNNIGYLEGTAFPTLPGNTALTAHVVLPNGVPGPFARLNELGWKDEIQLQTEAGTYVYHVVYSWSTHARDLSVLRHEELDFITLITCIDFDSRVGTYRQRLAVRAVLVEVK